MAYAFSKRRDEHSELFSRIRALRYRFMAQFGKDASAPFTELKSILDGLHSDLRFWVGLSLVDTSKYNQDELRSHKESVDKYAKALWSSPGEDDPVSLRVKGVVKTIEQMCRPQIDRRGVFRLRVKN